MAQIGEKEDREKQETKVGKQVCFLFCKEEIVKINRESTPVYYFNQ